MLTCLGEAESRERKVKDGGRSEVGIWTEKKLLILLQDLKKCSIMGVEEEGQKDRQPRCTRLCLPVSSSVRDALAKSRLTWSELVRLNKAVDTWVEKQPFLFT